MQKMLNQERILRREYIEKLGATIVEEKGLIIDQNGAEVYSSLAKTSALYQTFYCLTNDYTFMQWVGNDHFIVGSGYYSYETMKEAYGVICLVRDSEGRIIPFNEKIVVPIIYDNVLPSNSQTVIVEKNGLYTYYDVDPESPNYAHRMFPLKLTKAICFDCTYEGFAECKMGDYKGYLARASIEKNAQHQLDLLTEKQVKAILPYLKKFATYPTLVESAIEKVNKQTDGAMVLKRTKPEDKKQK